jgi:hypothetical protein
VGSPHALFRPHMPPQPNAKPKLPGNTTGIGFGYDTNNPVPLGIRTKLPTNTDSRYVCNFGEPHSIHAIHYIAAALL